MPGLGQPRRTVPSTRTANHKLVSDPPCFTAHGGSLPYLDATFSALSHSTRRDILARLALGESTVSDIAAPYDISLNSVSKHLMVLEQARLVTRRVEGRVHHISLNPQPLRTASQWLQFYRAFWEKRLDALAEFLSRKKGAHHAARGPHHAPIRGLTRRGI